MLNWIAYYSAKVLSALLRCLPHTWVLAWGHCLGLIVYGVSHKRRRIVYQNLKCAFGNKTSLPEIHRITRQVFVHFTQNMMELLCLPKIARQGFNHYVDFQGKEHIDAALGKGRGAIFLPVHLGNWEISNIVGSSLDHPYNVVTTPQDKISQLGELLNEYRASAGANIIHPGFGSREIIQCLKRNEIVAMMGDQGGREGELTDFFGKNASMSIGAIKLAQKYGTPILLVKMIRQANGKHALTVSPGITVHENDSIKSILSTFFKDYQAWIAQSPEQYMWFYKVWKFSDTRRALILNDGRVGHLRQSEAVAQYLRLELKGRSDYLHIQTVDVAFSSQIMKSLWLFLTLFMRLGWAPKASILKLFLKKDAYEALVHTSWDYVISTGSLAAGINYCVAKDNDAQNIAVLKPGLLGWHQFSCVFLMPHDWPQAKALPNNVHLTTVALNTMDSYSLSRASDRLLERYSHLKSNLKSKLGLLIGGDAGSWVMDERQIKIIFHQIKEVLESLNLDVLISTSRRTPAHIEALVKKEFKKYDRCPLLVIPNQEDVPDAVGGIFALSDLLLISSESVSMVSEAVSSAKPTIVYAINENSKAPVKYDQFIQGLCERQHVVMAKAKTVGQRIYDVFKQKVYTKPYDQAQDIRAILKEVL